MSDPKQLGKYPITGVLGRGAMGVVYKAFDPVINRPVAIKTIHKALIGQDMSGSSGAARFRNEARAVGRLSHPGIVSIYEYGEDDTTAYIAMEYVEGRTLSQILAGAPRPPEADILTLMDQLLAALDCAHQASVWHRDIKPANLIVTDAGRLKVTDFGIARIESMALTQMTSSIGTPGYMAPEQYDGTGLDHRVDVFSAGVLLYCMLAGHPPFTGNAETVMYKVMNETPPPPSRLPEAGRPEFYDSIVARAMAKNANERYSHVAEFRQALAKRVVPQGNDDTATTVIIVKPGTRPPPAAAGAANPSAPGSSPSSGSGAIAGWDAGTLLEVEVALASYVGPMAKVLVRQAARTCTGFSVLMDTVSAHLPNDADRKSFVAKMGATTGPRPTSGAGPGVSSPGRGSGGAGNARPLSPEVIAAAQKVLARHIGPIASVVIRKSAKQARTEEQFFQLLVDQADGTDRARLLTELRRSR